MCVTETLGGNCLTTMIGTVRQGEWDRSLATLKHLVAAQQVCAGHHTPAAVVAHCIIVSSCVHITCVSLPLSTVQSCSAVPVQPLAYAAVRLQRG